MFAFNIMHQKQNIAPFLSPCLSYWKQVLAFSPIKLLGSFSKGLHIYILCIFQQWGARAKSLKTGPQGPARMETRRDISRKPCIHCVANWNCFSSSSSGSSTSHIDRYQQKEQNLCSLTSLMERLPLFSTNSAKPIRSLRNISF